MIDLEKENPIFYHVLVSVVGVTAGILTCAFYLVYLTLWSEITKIIEYSKPFLFVSAFLALGLSYLLVRLFAETKITGSGTHTVLEVFHLRNGDVSFRDALIKPLASMFTLGFGGSAGPEGPSLLLGGGVASGISKKFKVKTSFMRGIFISGAAAGLSATFRTPLTGILFALEIPYKREFERETFIDASIASIVSYLVSVTILGSERIFKVVENVQLSLDNILLSLLLGLLCGVYALFFVKAFSLFGRFGSMIRKKAGSYGVIALGSIMLGAAGYSSLYNIGVGLNFIDALVYGEAMTLTFLVIVILVRTFATCVTLNFGGGGGLFFPTIVIGAGIGYLFSKISGTTSQELFIAIAMAALLAGTHKILLTPVAFIVETLGGGYAIPALLASGVSYLVSGKFSFYPLQLDRKLKYEELALERFYIDAKNSIQERLRTTVAKDFMTKNVLSLNLGMNIKDALGTFSTTHFRILPVIDQEHDVVGYVTLEDLGHIRKMHYEKNISGILIHKPLIVHEETSLEKVADSMIERDEDHVFVTDNKGKLLGVIASIDVVRKILELSA
jgi:CIC family chloride channel protein